jgi:murein L,D-transpeptidase YcbB/YkuD
MKKTGQAALTALMMSCAFSFAAVPAHSATLLDLLRGNSKAKESVAGSLDDDLGAFPDPAKPAKPLPKVKSPSYFTYKPDQLRLIAVAKFAPSMQSVSTDATSDTTGSIEAVSLNNGADPAQSPRAFMGEVRVKAPKEVADAIEKFYTGNDRLLWVENGAVSEKARAAIAELTKADMVGLEPEDYKVVDPSDTFDAVDAQTKQRQLMQFEIELSTAVLTYVQDAQRGRIDPNRIAEYYDFKRKTVNLDGALMNITASPDIARYLESRSPANAEFEALKRELAALKTAAGEEGQKITIAPGTLLKPGEANPELANIIEAIRHRGSDKLKVDHSVTLAAYQGSVDYTPELVDLVKAFQAENGLKGDGIVGKGTIRVLVGGDSSAAKINKLVIAMEQLRWLPKDLGQRYVFINQPAFTAYYHNGGKEEFNMRVVVGSKAHQTFFFQDEIELVEFNPYWGVPRSIIVNEMLPKLREDPTYLDRLGYETSVRGQQLSSTEIDWHQTDAVDVRQPPGSGNALGQLKIMFPNAHSIYMHDTPQKKFFQRDMRALSHGCVRLVDPKKMAAAVMGMSVDQIEAQISTGKNHQMKVPEKFPVYVSYFTAWPNKDGVVEYFDDVYDRDMYMNRALDATRKVRQAAI